ncbi:MAG: VCBS repeat-containing protein [Planctomycetes bacterium]|nr:VCBS repeat-containing protein [Planctomycetota bacterium]
MSLRLATFVAVALACVCASSFAALTVSTVAPANLANGVSPARSVVLTFNQPLDPTTVTPAAFKLMGKTSGVVPIVVSLDAGATQVTLAPTRPYFLAETVHVRVASSVRSATQEALTRGFQSAFTIGGGASSKQFQLADVVEFRLAGEGLTRLYGFNALDVDGDGSPDMSGTNEVSSDVRVKRNDGCGAFGPTVIVPLPSGGEPSPNDVGDFDGDGRADLVTGNQNGNSIALFRNDGAGSYLAPIVVGVGGSCHGVAALDVDGDGDLDLAAANLTDVRVLKNDGVGGLTVSGGVDAGGGGEWQVATADADGDGRFDLFVSNYYSGSIGLLRASGAASFTLSATKSTGATAWPIGAGDVNGDGFADAVVGDNQNGVATLVRGNGAGGFGTSSNYPVGSQPVGVRLGDLDGDADLDLSVANFGSADCTVYFNNGGAFVAGPVLDSEISGSCSVLIDYDRDGDTDVVVTDEITDKAFVYRQIGPAHVGVQAPTCAATLRIDQRALRGGFGGMPATPLALGSTTFLGITGGASQPYAVFLGVGQSPGSPSAAGLFHLSATGPLLTLVSGFGGFGPTTNAVGEALLPVALPQSAITGVPITLQGAVGAPSSAAGAVLTNPETIVLVP